MTEVILFGIEDQVSAYILLLFVDFVEDVVVEAKHL